MCKRQFTNVEVKIAYGSDGVLVVSLRDKLRDEVFQECFRMEGRDMEYEKYLFVSALSGMAISNQHYIYSIKSFDLDRKIDKRDYDKQA